MGITLLPGSAAFALRSKSVYAVTVLIFLFLCLLFTPLPEHYDDSRDAILHKIAITAPDTPAQSLSGTVNITDLAHVKSKHAFATFLAGSDEVKDYEDQPYFIAIRILTYQLLYAPETKSRDDAIPFIVLVTDKVTEIQRARLRADGALVVPAEHLGEEWIKADSPAWGDVMTKLRLWELTQFERICFLDGDTQLMAPLDDIFSDPAVVTHQTGNKTNNPHDDEASMPSTYSFGGVPEMKQKHKYPPTEDDFPNINYLNAGFLVFEPSNEMFNYFKSVMSIPDRFIPSMPEQNLLNYALRKDGNMPWMQLNNTWNIHYPSKDDLYGGVKSIHEKWWAPNPDLKDFMISWRWKMEGFFQARDQQRTV